MLLSHLHHKLTTNEGHRDLDDEGAPSDSDGGVTVTNSSRLLSTWQYRLP